MAKLNLTAKTLTGLTVKVQKDFYDGLWYIRYEDGMKYAGPYKTRKEAIEKLEFYTK